MNQIRPPSIRAKTRLVSEFLTTSSNNMIQQHASDSDKKKHPHRLPLFQPLSLSTRGGYYGHLSFIIVLHLCLCYHISLMLSCSCLYEKYITCLLAYTPERSEGVSIKASKIVPSKKRLPFVPFLHQADIVPSKKSLETNQ